MPRKHGQERAMAHSEEIRRGAQENQAAHGSFVHKKAMPCKKPPCNCTTACKNCLIDARRQ